jgi:hypothetical protein
MNNQKMRWTFYTHKEFVFAGELGECLESGWKIKKHTTHRRGVNAQDGGSLVVLSIRS